MSSFPIPSDALLEHWQDHRALTRRVIEAFPEDKLYTYSLGGMRSFGKIAIELQCMAEPTLRGFVTGKWEPWSEGGKELPKADLLKAWDDSTQAMNELWPRLTPERFLETDSAFGQWTGPIYTLMLYIIDNEIHHRGQGYVYLRSLGIEPPPFYARGPWKA